MGSQSSLFPVPCLKGMELSDQIVQVGIDPGFSGALAWKRDESSPIETMYMPTLTEKKGKKTRTHLDALKLSDFLYDIFDNSNPASYLVLEKVSAMRGQGVTSMFRFGEGYGIIQGICAAFRIPVYLITPQKWKKSILDGLGKDKGVSVRYVRQTHPEVDLGRLKTKMDGMADAVCMLLYGMKEIRDGRVQGESRES